jgi:hypothetical protein
MKIIKHCETVEETAYRLEWECTDCPGAGFAFDCDADGNVQVERLTGGGLANFLALRGGTMRNVTGPTMRTYTWTRVEPAVGRCVCGRLVDLDGFTCGCDCGRLYNWAGQELAPPCHWGEETGEQPADLLRIR